MVIFKAHYNKDGHNSFYIVMVIVGTLSHKQYVVYETFLILQSSTSCIIIHENYIITQCLHN